MSPAPGNGHAEVSSRYAVFGLVVASDIPLPELPAASGQEATDVRIALGPIDLPEGEPGYFEVVGGTLMSIPRVGRYLMRGGREIVVEPCPEASARNVRLFLLGSALGALLHQRGLLPLHANAIEIGGAAVAFCGHSGAGKSTIAAWFHDRGHRVMTDDVCVVGFDAAGGAIAYPGIPRLRLWREALEASGRDTASFHRSFDERDKYDVPTQRDQPGNPMPLAAVYLLRKADEGSGPAGVQRLFGIDAVETLVANTYRGAYLARIGKTAEHLATCVRLARSLPVFAARRRWGFEAFEEQALELAAHAGEWAALRAP